MVTSSPEVSSPDLAVQEAKAKRRRSFVLAAKILFWSGLGLSVAAVGGALLMVNHYSENLPRVEDLSTNYAPPQMTRVLARDGTLLGESYSERRTVIPFASIPDHVKAAFLAAEDAHFYEHGGLNYLGMLRALVTNLRAGGLRQGGSTITQQVVKNVLLTATRSYERKIKETVLSYRLEKELTKDQILGMYLNHIYLGHGRYGIEEASRYLFGKPAKELEVAEAALLAGIVAAPEKYSPRKSEELARKRRSYVLGQMLAKGFVTEPVYRAAESAPIRLAPSVETESDIAPELVDHSRRVLHEMLGERASLGGYTVMTTLEPELQVLARKALRAGLDQYLVRQKLAAPFTLAKRKLWAAKKEQPLRKHGIYVAEVTGHDDQKGLIELTIQGVKGTLSLAKEERYNPTHLSPSAFASVGAGLRVRLLDDVANASPEHPLRFRLELGPEAALVAIDVRTGDVVAAIGSYEALPGGLNRTVQAKRQPGSTFKPLLYSYALSARQVTLATVFEFLPKGAVADSEPPPVLDRLSLRRGVAKSDNRVAEEVIRRVGAGQVVPWAQALGIRSHLGATASLALGAYEVTPLEMATAFSVFARGGELVEPRFISRITSGGAELPLPPVPGARQVLDPEVAYLTTSMLGSVISEGTAQAARALKRPAAGKTGTTNQAKDAWFVGYTTDYVAAVWVGYDDALPLGGVESGAVTALPIWVEFMRGAHQGRPEAEFPKPAALVTASIDPETGLLARPDQTNAYDELFLPGTEPTTSAEEAPEPVEPPPPGSLDGGPADGDAATAIPEVSGAPPAPPVELPPF